MGLGAHIEGDAADVLESLPTDTIGIGPYLCIVDEYAAIVASQDYAGIVEADKKGAQQIVANTTLKVFM